MARLPLDRELMDGREDDRPPAGRPRQEAGPEPGRVGPPGCGRRVPFWRRRGRRHRFHVEIRGRRAHKNSAAVPMNLPSDSPRLPKWIFFVGYASLISVAWLIHDGADHPWAGWPLLSIVALVA